MDDVLITMTMVTVMMAVMGTKVLLATKKTKPAPLLFVCSHRLPPAKSVSEGWL